MVGVDSSELAIRKAVEKAAKKHVKVSFKVWDALHLDELGIKFASAIDCGFFHTLSDEARVRYRQNLHSVLKSGGRYFMLAFSDQEPGWGGPRRISREEIRATFGKGWHVEAIEEARFEDHSGEGGARAWLSTIERV